MSNNKFLICKGDGKRVLAIDYDYWCDSPREWADLENETMWHLVFDKHPIYDLPCEEHPTMCYEELFNNEEYLTVPLSFIDGHNEHIFFVNDSHSFRNGYAWCKKNGWEADYLIEYLRCDLKYYSNWANGYCYQAFIYDYSGELVDCMSGIIADDEEEAYEMQKSYEIGFDFNKAHDVFVCWNMYFEDKE